MPSPSKTILGLLPANGNTSGLPRPYLSNKKIRKKKERIFEIKAHLGRKMVLDAILDLRGYFSSDILGYGNVSIKGAFFHLSSFVWYVTIIPSVIPFVDNMMDIQRHVCMGSRLVEVFLLFVAFCWLVYVYSRASKRCASASTFAAVEKVTRLITTVVHSSKSAR